MADESEHHEHHPLQAFEADVAGDASGARGTIDIAVAEADSGKDGLERTMGPVNLTAIGVAAVVGAGIFVVTGHAAAVDAGPAVIVSFVIAGVVATLAAVCYSELASMIPLSGSTYSYAYSAMGTFVAWVIGWDLLVEYLFGAANVANGWSGYFTNLLAEVGVEVPNALRYAPVSDGGAPTGIMNLPAMCLVAFVTFILYMGSKESARATTLFVGVKLVTLAVFVGFGVFSLTWGNYTPFIPPPSGGHFGWGGIFVAAGTVFYSYISFDAVCTAAQEAKNPRRTVPIGVMGSLGIATVLYVIVGFVLVGLVSYTALNVSDPLSSALEAAGLGWVGTIVDIGAVIGLAASVTALLFSQTRILMRMSEDGMLPKRFSVVSKTRKVPEFTILLCGLACIVMTGLLPLAILTELISIGTLLAFMIVAAAVIVLRKTRPDLKRPFKVPGGPTIPIISILASLVIMLSLPWETWLRLFIWLAIGLVIYFLYSKSRADAVIVEREKRQREARSPEAS